MVGQMDFNDFPELLPGVQILDDDQLMDIWNKLPAGVRGYITGGGHSEKMLQGVRIPEGWKADRFISEMRRISQKVKGWRK